MLNTTTRSLPDALADPAAYPHAPGEVELRELAAAYATLARGGAYAPLRFTVADTAALGEPASTTPVIDPAVAALVSEVLADPLARVRGLHGRVDLGLVDDDEVVRPSGDNPLLMLCAPC